MGLHGVRQGARGTRSLARRYTACLREPPPSTLSRLDASVWNESRRVCLPQRWWAMIGWFFLLLTVGIPPMDHLHKSKLSIWASKHKAAIDGCRR